MCVQLVVSIKPHFFVHSSGHLESKSSIKRVLAITAVLALAYSITQVMADDERLINHSYATDNCPGEHLCWIVLLHVVKVCHLSRALWRSCIQTVTCLQRTSTSTVTAGDTFGWPAPASSSWSAACVHNQKKQCEKSVTTHIQQTPDGDPIFLSSRCTLWLLSCLKLQWGNGFLFHVSNRFQIRNKTRMFKRLS